MDGLARIEGVAVLLRCTGSIMFIANEHLPYCHLVLNRNSILFFDAHYSAVNALRTNWFRTKRFGYTVLRCHIAASRESQQLLIGVQRLLGARCDQRDWFLAVGCGAACISNREIRETQ